MESDHLTGDVDMFEVIRRLVGEKKRREKEGETKGMTVGKKCSIRQSKTVTAAAETANAHAKRN